MTLFAFRRVKSHEWTFYDPNKFVSKTCDQPKSLVIWEISGTFVKYPFIIVSCF